MGLLRAHSMGSPGERLTPSCHSVLLTSPQEQPPLILQPGTGKHKRAGHSASRSLESGLVLLSHTGSCLLLRRELA